jgi:hypothetical protein
MPTILYVSDSIFFPSILTGHISLELSPLNSTSMSSTIGVRQSRRGPWPICVRLALLAQLTTAVLPSSRSKENIAPRTEYEPTNEGVAVAVVFDDPQQFAVLGVAEQFAAAFEFD